MLAPVLVNAGFEMPVVAGGAWAANPTGSGVGWFAAVGTNWGVARTSTLYDGAFAYVAGGSAFAQDFTSDGTPVKLRLAAKGAVGTASVDGVVVVNVPAPGAWTVFESATLELAAGTHRLQIAFVGPGSQLHVDSVEFVAVAPPAAPGRLLCFEAGASGLLM